MKSYNLPSDAVWFITGCSSGIGQSLAQQIATKTTNRVIATARNPSTLSDIPSSPTVLKLALDVTSSESIATALESSLKEFGRIDVFVNNAGHGLFSHTELVPTATAQAAMDTNFWGSVEVTRRALPIMRETNALKGGQKGGVVVQVTSFGGRLAYPGNAFYHASKFALEGWTEGLSKEMPPDWNIHFMLVEPGGTKTKYVANSKVPDAVDPEAIPEVYRDPSLPTNGLRAYIDNPASMATWATVEGVADRIYTVVKDGIDGVNEGKGGLPLRLPLGSDSFGLQKMALEAALKEFEVLAPVSLSVSPKEQLEGLVKMKGQGI